MKEKLLKAIKEAEARTQVALDAMATESTDKTMDAYEMCLKAENLLRTQLVQLEQRETPSPMQEAASKQEAAPLSEGVRWAQTVMEAVAVGSTYTGLIPTEVATQIQMKKETYSKYRQFCTVHMTTGSYAFAVEGDGVTVSYVAEGGAISDSTSSLTPVTLSAYKLAALVKISREAAADPAVSFLDYIVTVIAKGFAKKEDAEILNGTGSAAGHMTGLVPTVSAVAARVVTSAAGSASFTWAELKTFLQKIGDYQGSAHLVMNAATRDYIQEFKNGSDYVFPQDKALADIWGMPIIIDSVNMEAPASAKNVILGGDLAYYHIADRQALEITTLTELYAASDQVGIRAVQRIDGKCALTDAFAVFTCDTF